MVGSISRYSTFNFDFYSIFTREDPRTGKTIYFTPEVEDKVIRESFSYKLYRSLVNPPKKVWIDSTQTKAPTSSLQFGDPMRYTNEGYNEMVDLVEVNTNDPDSIKYIINLLRVNTMIVTKEFLKSRNVPYIGSIQISS